LLLEVYDVRQWLNKYPTHKAVDLRGNVNTRMQKLQDSDWNGAIFAAAGLERINLKPQNYINLDWMIPRPAQEQCLLSPCRKIRLQ
jgi:hydroxymethylbilane synthase